MAPWGPCSMRKGVFINRCFDELNLSLAALVREIHQEYVKAGAEILETNTFGANRKRLAAFGFAEKVRPSTRPACGIAREAARRSGVRGGRRGSAGRAPRTAGAHLFRRSARDVPRADRGAGGGRRRSADSRNVSRIWTKCAKPFSRRAKPPGRIWRSSRR